MTSPGIPANYHCSISGVTFPTIYKIHHPGMVRGLPGVESSVTRYQEYNLEPVSQHPTAESSTALEVEELRRLGPGSGIDLHLTHFDSRDKADGYIHAIRQMNREPVYPSRLSTEQGVFVLVAEKSDLAKNRVHFHVFREAFTSPFETIFNQNGECVGHPSDC